MNIKPYPSYVSDDEWAFVASYLTLMVEETPQREYTVHEVFNGLRYVVRQHNVAHGTQSATLAPFMNKRNAG